LYLYSDESKIDKIDQDFGEANNFISFLNNNECDEVDMLCKMPDHKVYEYFNFAENIKNWNDFLQPKFSKNTFNEIKMIDIDNGYKGSYHRGYEFFNNDNFKYYYLELFEDNFRKFLEECERLEILNINIDYNTFWGGLSIRLLEELIEQVPKISLVIQGDDLNSNFFNKDSFDTEKFTNYLWFFADLYSFKKTIHFLPIYHNEQQITELFDSKSEFSHQYYYSSLCGSNLHNFYIPFRSKAYGLNTTISNLIHNNYVNFYETDTIFLDYDLLINLSRTNIKDWKKIFSRSEVYNKFNTSIVHGYDVNHHILNQKIDNFMLKHSGFNYTCVDKIALPLCFPRKICVKNKEYSVDNLSLMSNYRPFYDFSKLLSKIPVIFKQNEFNIKKYLIYFDSGKYIESKDKIEEIYSILDIYNWCSDIDGEENEIDI